MINKSEINESSVQTSLVRLQKFDITLMILQRTGIGKTLNELRRLNINANLLTMAKNLLKKWKNLLSNSSDKEMDTIRLKSRELLSKALSIAEIPEGSRIPEELSIHIEEAIFKQIKNTNVKYGRRIRSRLFNLKDLKNPDLRSKVLLGIITPEQFAIMTPEEMTSDNLKKENEKLREITCRESFLPIDEGSGCDLIKCERCKTNNCSYSELQTLSGDEPMTLFVYCRNCGHRWRG
ncbi:hypothetical protein I4U23_005782 [Adineta vaga]|nr:hypothetical protein I4U23_005782 [Adineta vaga]